MSIFLLILGFCVIPIIFNLVYAYLTVKFGLWNWVAEVTLHSNTKRIEDEDIKFMVYPLTSFILMCGIIVLNLATVLYYIVKFILHPFIKFYNLLSSNVLENFNKIESKNEFYDKLNNNGWKY